MVYRCFGSETVSFPKRLFIRFFQASSRSSPRPGLDADTTDDDEEDHLMNARPRTKEYYDDVASLHFLAAARGERDISHASRSLTSPQDYFEDEDWNTFLKISGMDQEETDEEEEDGEGGDSFSEEDLTEQVQQQWRGLSLSNGDQAEAAAVPIEPLLCTGLEQVGQSGNARANVTDERQPSDVRPSSNSSLQDSQIGPTETACGVLNTSGIFTLVDGDGQLSLQPPRQIVQPTAGQIAKASEILISAGILTSVDGNNQLRVQNQPQRIQGPTDPYARSTVVVSNLPLAVYPDDLLSLFKGIGK